MNPQAAKLNETLRAGNSHVFEMLSDLGRDIYFPKLGILSQSAEAKAKAGRYNATIGTALEGGQAMHLGVIQDTLSAYEPKDLYDYAPASGKPELRAAWKKKMVADNPSMEGKAFSHPIVTNALTHGLSIVADLFAGPGDAVIIPDKNWENYELTFGVRRGAEMVEYPLYNGDGRFNDEGLKQAILAAAPRGKAIVVLNFPNNPTGYTPGAEEGRAIVAAVREGAEAGINLVVVTDDAYFGLFFEDSLHESVFGQLCGLHPRILPIKIDGATKEEYAWGFRVGFVTGATPDKWARTWRERYARDPLELVPLEVAAQEEALQSGRVDAALVRPPVDTERWHLIRLYEETIVVAFSADSHLAAGEELTPEDLAGEVLVVPTDDLLDPHFAGTLAPAFAAPRTTADAIEIVASGVGIVIVPMSLARLHHRKDVEYRALSGAAPAPVGFAWPREDASPLVDTFIGILRGRTAQSSRD